MSTTPELSNEATSADLQSIFGAPPSPSRTPDSAAKPSDCATTPPDVAQNEPMRHIAAPLAADSPEAPPVDPNAIKHVEEKTKALGAKKFEVKAKTAAGINYAAAFLLFCKGFSLQEIADEFGMRYGALLDKARTEDWDRLAKKQTTLVAPPPRAEIAPFNAALLEKKQAAITANREESAKLASDLRADIRKVLVAYQTENAFLRPDDILTLAKAEKLLQEISMVALGDEFVMKTPTGGAGTGSGQPSIVINLPAAVSNPRLPRAVAPEQEASDLSSAHNAPVESPEAIEEVTIVGAKTGDAIAAKSKRGHSVNFAVLETVAAP